MQAQAPRGPGGMVSLAALAGLIGRQAQAPETSLANIGSRFDTQLLPHEEKQYILWKKKYAPNDSGEDYDLRGAFKAGLVPDENTGHWPDTFKKPNHPTFSVESQYAQYGNPGSWEGNQFMPASNERTVDAMADSLRFNQAFAKARKMGLVEFTWRGKPYTTKYASEKV